MTDDTQREADYHDAHLDDEDEWGAEPAQEATVRPSGMTVYSMRLPSAELDAMRSIARQRATTVSELIRASVRSYLAPRGSWVYFSGSFVPQFPMAQWEGGKARVPVTYDSTKDYSAGGSSSRSVPV